MQNTLDNRFPFRKAHKTLDFVAAVKMFMQKITDLSQFLIAGERSHSIPHPSTQTDGAAGARVDGKFSHLTFSLFLSSVDGMNATQEPILNSY